MVSIPVLHCCSFDFIHSAELNRASMQFYSSGCKISPCFVHSAIFFTFIFRLISILSLHMISQKVVVLFSREYRKIISAFFCILEHVLVHDLHDGPNIDLVVVVIIDGRIFPRYLRFNSNGILLPDHDLDHVQHHGNISLHPPSSSILSF